MRAGNFGRSAALMLVGIMLLGSGAIASSPAVSTYWPPGVTRGGEPVDVAITGDALSDITSIQWEHPGITATEIVAEDDKKASFKISVAADVAPGLYPFRAVTRTGISNLRMMGVGTLPIVDEVEPNSAFDAAQPIEINRTVQGIVKREDIDYFAVTLEEGQTIHAEIEGLRLHYTINNQNIFDPSITILDADRFEVASSDDASLWQQDGLCTLTAPAAGTYVVAVRDASFVGHDQAAYRLHVGTFPRPVVVVPPGGAAGTTLDAVSYAPDGSSLAAKIELPNGDASEFLWTAEHEGALAPSPVSLRVTNLPITSEVEPNSSFDNATDMSVPGAAWGVIEASQNDADEDMDFFVCECKKGQKYNVSMFARDPLRSPVDAIVSVFGPDKKHIGSADDVSGKPDPWYQFTAAADGQHFIRVRDHLRRGSPLHLYWFEITLAEPSVLISPKELRRDEAYQVEVPAGGHGVVIVTAKRDSHGGVITPRIDNLPTGVTAQIYPIPNGRGEMPIVLSATADAPLGAAPLVVSGDEANVDYQYEQTVKTVLGQNQRSLYSLKYDHNFMVVREPNPFEIEVLAPTSPILRGGNKTITMRIKRGETAGDPPKPFANAVAVRAAYNPPGIGINNGQKFDKETTEIQIPITANDSAALGEWPMVFVLRYGMPGLGGGSEVSTPPVMLDIQEKWFKIGFPSQATGEIGGRSSVTVDIEPTRELPAEASVQLLGLPKGVTSAAEIQPVTAETKSVTFPIEITSEAKSGLNKTLIVEVVVKTGDDPVKQTAGGGAIRVDDPPPQKVEAEKPATAEPEKPAIETPKPLSRLEQLRAAAESSK